MENYNPTEKSKAAANIGLAKCVDLQVAKTFSKEESVLFLP